MLRYGKRSETHHCVSQFWIFERKIISVCVSAVLVSTESDFAASERKIEKRHQLNTITVLWNFRPLNFFTNFSGKTFILCWVSLNCPLSLSFPNQRRSSTEADLHRLQRWERESFQGHAAGRSAPPANVPARLPYRPDLTYRHFRPTGGFL